MQGTDPFLPPAASGGDSENAAPAGQERRAAGGRRAGTPQPPSPGPRPRGAPLPRQEGPASRSHRGHVPGTPGGQGPSFLQLQIHAKGAPPGGAPSPAQPGSSPETPSLRPDPSPPFDFTASGAPPFLSHDYGSPASEERGAGFSVAAPGWLPRKHPRPRAPTPHRPNGLRSNRWTSCNQQSKARHPQPKFSATLAPRASHFIISSPPLP